MTDALTGNTGPTQTLVDSAIAVAKNAPDLEKNLKIVSPDLVQMIEAPAMTAAHGAYGTAIVGLVGLAVAHYSLGWDSGFQSLVAGAIILGGSALVHGVSTFAFPSNFFKGIKL